MDRPTSQEFLTDWFRGQVKEYQRLGGLKGVANRVENERKKKNMVSLDDLRRSYDDTTKKY